MEVQTLAFTFQVLLLKSHFFLGKLSIVCLSSATLQGFRNCGEAGKTTWVECFSGRGSGTAGVAFSSAEEAANAITMLNGTGASAGHPVEWDGFGLGTGRNM
jgi:hypothetical protein